MSNKNISGFIKYIKNIEGDMLMNLLIFFAIVLSTIILAIVLQRIINCPILVGFAFFAIYLIVAAVLANLTFVIIAIILGIVAFLSAFIDCILRRSGFFRNNNCLNCNNNDNSGGNNNTNSYNCGCSCNNDDSLTIVNNNGEVVARIDGNSITCNSDNLGCLNNFQTNAVLSNNNTNVANCGCNNRFRR